MPDQTTSITPLADFVFPPSPTPDQQVTAPDGTVWQWNATTQRWVRLATVAGQFWQGGAGGAIYYNAGSIGIGTNTPDAMLSVVATTTATGINSERYASDNTPPIFYSYKSRGTQAVPQDIQTNDYLMYLGFGGRVAGFTGSQGAISAKADQAEPRRGELIITLNDGTDLTGNGQDRMRFYATPTGGTWIEMDCPSTTQNGSYLGFNQAGTYVAEIGAWHHTGGSPSGGLSIDVGAFSANIFVDYFNGRVGINQGTPEFQLDVNGTFNCTEWAQISSASPTTGGAYLAFYQGTQYIADIGAFIHGGAGDGLTIDVGAMNGAIYVLHSNGYVGIGIGGAAGPAYPLDVNGDLNVRGNIYRSGSILPVAGGAQISATAPASPTDGDLWFDSTNVALCIRYQNAWVQVH